MYHILFYQVMNRRGGHHSYHDIDEEVSSQSSSIVNIVLGIAILAFIIYLFVKYLRWFWKIDQAA